MIWTPYSIACSIIGLFALVMSTIFFSSLRASRERLSQARGQLERERERNDVILKKLNTQELDIEQYKEQIGTLRSLLAAARSHGTMLEHRIEALEADILRLQALIDELAPPVSPEVPTMEQLDNAHSAKRYIERHYMQSDISARSLSETLRISPAALSRAFKVETNMSISEYIGEVRLQAALDRMRNSDESLQSIQSSVGFDNESYFYRFFKKKFGCTPREYMRKQNWQAI